MAPIAPPLAGYHYDSKLHMVKNPTVPTIRPEHANARQAALAAAKAKTKAKNRIPMPGKSKTPITTPSAPTSVTTSPDFTATVPTDPSLTPEDAALKASYDPSQIKLDNNDSLGNMAGKVQLPNALNYANSMANLQYGSRIQQMAGRIKGLTAALPGSIQALDKAFADIDSRRAATVVNPQTSGAGVANLFGGNTGAAAIAANQSAQASATAANQAGTLNDQQAASDRSKMDWQQRIQLLNNMQVNQGRSDLLGVEGERDSARKGYYDQGLKMRGDMISQAISNVGALRNQDITGALAAGQLENLGLKNEAQGLQNTLTGYNVAAAPALLQNSINAGQQDILNSITTRKITVAQAKQALQKAPGVVSLKGALSSGPGASDALHAMILPPTAVSQNTANGQYVFNGDPNSYFNAGVRNIMKTLPKSDRKNVRQYVADQINIALQGSGRSWTYDGKQGKFVKAAKKTTPKTK